LRVTFRRGQRQLRHTLTGLVLMPLLLAGVESCTRDAMRVASDSGSIVGPVTIRTAGAAPFPGVVHIADRTIRSIDAGDSPPPEARFAAHFLLPGLIDAHVHLPPWFLPGHVDLVSTLFLAHGVTAIRETGSFGSRPFALRDAIRAGDRAGPRIFACGAVLDGEPASFPFVRVARDAAEARAAVEELADDGADCIKVYSRISDEVLDAVREAAHSRGLPVIGHLPEASPWTETRLDEIQHVCDPRCWQMQTGDFDALIETAARAGITHTPTLAVYAGQLRSYDYEVSRESPLARLLPRFWRDVVWNPRYALGFRGIDAELHRAVVADVCDAVRRLHAAGVRVVAGTDPGNPFVVPGASLHEELRLLVRCGFTIPEAWAAATWQAGEALGMPGLGRIAVGAPADLLIFRDDPMQDLAALDTLVAVIVDGRLYEKAELDAALARQRAFFERPWIDAASVWLAEFVADRIARAH
jgi:imidazolonepropionase-like amidohydrolase